MPTISDDLANEPDSNPDNCSGNNSPDASSSNNSTNTTLIDAGSSNENSTGDSPSSNETIPEVKPANYTISEEEAINIAMPYIQAYASENSRIVTGIYPFFAYARDYYGLRGDATQKYPSWEIKARFEGVKDYIAGYTVLIWGDTGEVRSAYPQGIF